MYVCMCNSSVEDTYTETYSVLRPLAVYNSQKYIDLTQ